MDRLDLTADAAGVTAQLVDVESVSGDEAHIADLVEARLRGCGHLHVERDGNVVLARTDLGRPQRVVLAGHLDTVPVKDNLPSRVEEGLLYGRGSCDMKGGVAVQLRLAAHVAEPDRDVTYVFYDCEEVANERNGLTRIARTRPDWLAGDFAVLLEPTDATVEGGCQGNMRVEVTVPGKAAHSARWWMGSNAVHAAHDVLARLVAYRPREVEVDGLVYREGLNAVRITGGVAGNVVPDECVVEINHRFAPSRSEAEAEAHLRELFEGYPVRVVDTAPGALPGLTHPAARAFVDAIGLEPRPKFGWTDVARFSLLGVPAVNYGPGDPNLAHTDDEHAPVASILECEERMRAWLSP
ncbi:MAG: succinyl-diaminopimelate desuccinylase [Streptosporangiales bacterium]|nr:succinyl-diaminopimelate desuccinylase [Streptosporangiales bacterium]MBO0890710.1 succinyl-diaminopimelate desuccinylase [Acidothermales bacterium]